MRSPATPAPRAMRTGRTPHGISGDCRSQPAAGPRRVAFALTRKSLVHVVGSSAKADAPVNSDGGAPHCNHWVGGCPASGHDVRDPNSPPHHAARAHRTGGAYWMPPLVHSRLMP